MAFLVTEWICVLNKLSFDSAAYPDIVCLRKDTFLQKIKTDYLAKNTKKNKLPSPPSGAAPVKKTQIYKKHINMKRKYKKEMEGVNHNVSTFMH